MNLRALIIIAAMLVGVVGVSASYLNDSFSTNTTGDYLNYGFTWSTGQVASTSGGYDSLFYNGFDYEQGQNVTALITVTTGTGSADFSGLWLNATQVGTNAGDQDGYACGFRGNSKTLLSFLNANVAWVSTASFTWTSGGTYWVKANYDGATFRCKAWENGDPEPSAWMIETAYTTAPQDPGSKFGVGNFNSATTTAFDLIHGTPTPGNTTYVSLTAVDAYDGSSISTFNGTAFLGSNYNRTAVGAVNTWVFDEEVEYYHFTPAVADPVTVATPAGCVLPSTLRKDGGDFDCQGSFGTWVKVRDFGESAVGVQGLYNQGSYSTANGTIVTTIDEDTQTNGTGPGGGEVADAYVLFEVEAENYYDNNSATFLANTGTTEASLAQGFVYFTCYELYTEDGLGCESGDSPLPRKAGSYTDQINVTDYFPVEYSYNVTALTTVFHDVYGFFDYNLTVSANDYAGNPEANFSINLYNENLSLNQSDNATGSSITYSLLSAYTYEVVLNATSTIYGDPVNQIGYANISINGAPPASESYQFNLSAARPVFVTLYYEENLTLFENPANLSLIPLSDSSEVFISTSTSNGTANFYNIPVAEYRLRVSSPGYHNEDRYFILSTYTGQNLTAYFRENTTGTEKEFNVVDERNILQNGWIIRFQRYYNDTGWITVDEARSNIDGLAVENVLSNEYYRVILLNEGLVEEYRSERTLLLQDTYQISSDVDTITNTQINKVLGVSGLVYMYPNLNRVEATGTSSSGTRDWKLELYRTYTDGPVLINSTTASGDSVNLSLYLPNATGRYYAVLSIMGSEIQTAANSIFIGGGPAAIGNSGAFYSFVLLLGIVGLAVFSAPAAIVLSIFALAVASMTGLFYVGLNAIVGLAIVGGMIIFRRNT